MKAYKLEILVIDFDNIGGEEIQNQIENTRYTNDCIYPNVKKVLETDIGHWHDDHPLNKPETFKEYYEEIFKP